MSLFHFEEMRKIQSLKKDYIYLPITDQIRSLLKGSNVNGKCYDGHLRWVSIRYFK